MSSQTTSSSEKADSTKWWYVSCAIANIIYHLPLLSIPRCPTCRGQLVVCRWRRWGWMGQRGRSNGDFLCSAVHAKHWVGCLEVQARAPALNAFRNSSQLTWEETHLIWPMTRDLTCCRLPASSLRANVELNTTFERWLAIIVTQPWAWDLKGGIKILKWWLDASFFNNPFFLRLKSSAIRRCIVSPISAKNPGFWGATRKHQGHIGPEIQHPTEQKDSRGLSMASRLVDSCQLENEDFVG